MDLIKPKTITIETQEGEKRDYILSKFPAFDGREIVCKYPLSGMPKLGDYKVNEETAEKLLSFVAVPMPNDNVLRLTSKALINNHVPDWETLAKIEWAMLEYNCSFFASGKVSVFLDQLAANIPQLITKILTDFSQQSSQAVKQNSQNSKPSTH